MDIKSLGIKEDGFIKVENYKPDEIDFLINHLQEFKASLKKEEDIPENYLNKIYKGNSSNYYSEVYTIPFRIVNSSFYEAVTFYKDEGRFDIYTNQLHIPNLKSGYEEINESEIEYAYSIYEKALSLKLIQLRGEYQQVSSFHHLFI